MHASLGLVTAQRPSAREAFWLLVVGLLLGLTTLASSVAAQTKMLQGGISNTDIQGGTGTSAGSPPLMDEFSSGGSGAPGGRRGNTTYPTGTQARQPNDPPCNNPFGCAHTSTNQRNPGPGGVYCQQSPGLPMYGPYSHTGTQTPCNLPGATQQPQNQQQQNQQQQKQTNVPPIFNFYYVNGINTPQSGIARPTGDPGGTYEYEFGQVKAKLVAAQATRVATSEADLMNDQWHNVSGKDNQTLVSWMNQCRAMGWTPDTKPQNDVEKTRYLPCIISNFWQAGGLAVGDVIECIAQGVKSPFSGIQFTWLEPLVVAIANDIQQKYSAELSQGPGARPNFFIVIAHSQGNFFAEGVAYRLFFPGAGVENIGSNGPFIANNRLGIIALGSPTQYDSLHGRLGAKLGHITRIDDGIHVLDAIIASEDKVASLGAGLPYVFSKRPFPDKDPALWPWKSGVVSFNGPLDVMAVFQWMNAGLAPLTTPFMNAHLLDNYLESPPATVKNVQASDRALPQNLSRLLVGDPKTAPPGRVVLPVVQQVLRTVKQSLLAGWQQQQQGQIGSTGLSSGSLGSR